MLEWYLLPQLLLTELYHKYCNKSHNAIQLYNDKQNKLDKSLLEPKS